MVPSASGSAGYTTSAVPPVCSAMRASAEMSGAYPTPIANIRLRDSRIASISISKSDTLPSESSSTDNDEPTADHSTALSSAGATAVPPSAPHLKKVLAGFGSLWECLGWAIAVDLPGYNL